MDEESLVVEETPTEESSEEIIPENSGFSYEYPIAKVVEELLSKTQKSLNKRLIIC